MRHYHNGNRGLITNNLWNYKKLHRYHEFWAQCAARTACTESRKRIWWKFCYRWTFYTFSWLWMWQSISVVILKPKFAVNGKKMPENIGNFFYIDIRWFLKSLFWICIINIVLALMLVRISWFECLFLNFIPFFDFLDLPKVFYFWQKENKTRFHSYQLECCWYFTSWYLELNARSLPFWVHSLHHHSPGNAWYWWSILSINNKYFLFMNYIVI